MGDLWLLLHVLSAFGLVTGIVGREITVFAARRAAEVGAIRAIMDSAGRFERLLVQPGSFVGDRARTGDHVGPGAVAHR